MSGARRLLVVAVPAGVAGVAGTAFYFRPRPDVEDGLWCRTRDILMKAEDPKAEVSEFLRAPRPPVGEEDVLKRPRALRVASAVVSTMIAVGTRMWMHLLNDFECTENEHLERLVEAIDSRPSGTPLVTVANHVSVADDPTLLCSMVPPHMLLQTELHRWGVCTQEACFKNDMLAAVIGCGKIMPIKRGAGVDQPRFLELCRHVAAGRWVHLFPEGKLNQGGSLGADWVGARPVESTLHCGGTLKWGVGKLVAHAPQRPLIIPFVSVGMHQLLPCDPVSGELKPLRVENLMGKRVVARVGAPIAFDDLVDAHVRTHGPLWKYGTSPQSEEGSWREHWQSSPEERKLYSAITARIEGALRRLEAEAQQQYAEAQGRSSK